MIKRQWLSILHECDTDMIWVTKHIYKRYELTRWNGTSEKCSWILEKPSTDIRQRYSSTKGCELYIYVCVCKIYVHISNTNIHPHTYIYTYIHPYTHTHTHIHPYIHTSIHAYTHIHPYMHACMHTHTYIYTYRFERKKHTYIHTYMHTHTYIHIHIYIQIWKKQNTNPNQQKKHTWPSMWSYTDVSLEYIGSLLWNKSMVDLFHRNGTPPSLPEGHQCGQVALHQ